MNHEITKEPSPKIVFIPLVHNYIISPAIGQLGLYPCIIYRMNAERWIIQVVNLSDD